MDSDRTTLKNLVLFPWDNGGEPFWVNPDNGLEWYVDLSMTKYCSKAMVGNCPPLNAVCFYVVERDGSLLTPITRVLVDRETNEVIYDNPRLEDMAVWIDFKRFVSHEE